MITWALSLLPNVFLSCRCDVRESMVDFGTSGLLDPRENAAEGSKTAKIRNFCLNLGESARMGWVDQKGAPENIPRPPEGF